MDMDALKQQLQEKANLSPEQAEKAAQVAIEFITERVPQLNSLLEQAGGGEGIAKKIGGLFNR